MISIDLGRSATKAVLRDLRRLLWPPLVARLEAPPPASVVEASETAGVAVQVGPRWWAVGEAARLAGHGAVWRRDEHKAADHEAVRAVVAAVAAVGGLDGDVRVALALPAGLWQMQAQGMASALVEPLGVRLLGEDKRSWIRPVPFILAEPVAAWLSVALDDSGSVVEDLSTTAAVLDLGHRTTDLAILVHARPAELRSSALGCVVAWEEWLREVVEPAVGLLRDDERVEIVSSAARGERPVVRGRVLPDDLLVQVAAYRRRWAARAVEEVRSLLAGVAFHRLILAGGGAEWARDELLDAFPYAHVVEDPRWAVAAGGLRYLRYRGRGRP